MPKIKKFLKIPNTTSNSPMKPDVPGRPTEERTSMINKTEKIRVRVNGFFTISLHKLGV